MTTLTPRAFEARLAQFTSKGFTELEIDAPLHGEMLCWTAFFSTEEDPYGGIAPDGVCACLNCTLEGAWAEDQHGHLYAGGKAELAALVGDAELKRWEAVAEEWMQ